jgi:predicted nuclease with RNAse H fold
MPANHTAVGIDVGGERKGFHAVAFQGKNLHDLRTCTSPDALARWCSQLPHADVIAVDAPCEWSTCGKSRAGERQLANEGIRCFCTPQEESVKSRGAHFYGWVFNGMRLYRSLENLGYRRFPCNGDADRVCFETFPHAIVWALRGRVIPARHKASSRRELLSDMGYAISQLRNVDFVDAALCAVAAQCFLRSETRCFGDEQEGAIVVPGCALAKLVKAR